MRRLLLRGESSLDREATGMEATKEDPSLTQLKGPVRYVSQAPDWSRYDSTNRSDHLLSKCRSVGRVMNGRVWPGTNVSTDV